MTDTTQDPFAAPADDAAQLEAPPAPPRASLDYTSLSLPKVALIASMRKLLHAVFSVAKNRRPFVPQLKEVRS